MPEIPNIVPDTVKTFETHWTNGLSDLEGTFLQPLFVFTEVWLVVFSHTSCMAPGMVRSDAPSVQHFDRDWNISAMRWSAMTFRTDINESKNKNPTDFAVFCKKTQ